MGHAVDKGGQPVAYVNVQFLDAADSSRAVGSVADDEGRFLLEPVPPGRYLLFVSLIGFRDYLSEPFRIDAAQSEHNVGRIQLVQEAVEMEELSVEARRTLYEQQGNRLVINVRTSISLAGKCGRAAPAPWPRRANNAVR